MKNILKDAVEYKDNIAVPQFNFTADQKTVDRDAEVKDAMFDALLAGKLDKTDIAIIEARNCSPMPSTTDVAQLIGVAQATVVRRLHKIKALITKAISTIS